MRRDEVFVVLLLALVEAHVLEQHDFARRAFDAVEPVLHKRHLAAEQLGRAAARPARARTPRRTRPPPAGRDATSRITRAPRARAHAWIVGSAARMRASLVTTPSFTGTLRSSRISTRLPRSSRSLIRRMAIWLVPALSAFDQASVVSSIRFEKPHSLSYQEHTLTSRAVDDLRHASHRTPRNAGHG